MLWMNGDSGDLAVASTGLPRKESTTRNVAPTQSDHFLVEGAKRDTQWLTPFELGKTVKKAWGAAPNEAQEQSSDAPRLVE